MARTPTQVWAVRLPLETIRDLNDLAERGRCAAADIVRPAIVRAVRSAKRREADAARGGRP